ncbi:MAG: CapA family protein [Patescibacteria group bacterium]|nr:CapA family protein [Patescibacteria group bacterium]
MKAAGYLFAVLAAAGAGWGAAWLAAAGFNEAAIAAANIPRTISFSQSAAAVSASDAIETPAADASSLTAPVSPASAVTPPISAPVPAAASSSTVTVLIGGDLMFDRYVRILGGRHGYDWLFSGIAPLMKSADIAVANLEGPIAATSSATVLADGEITTELSFVFEPAVVGALADAGFGLVSLANNHTYNRGAAGLAETKKWLSDAGIAWFGDPLNRPGDYRIVTAKGISIAFVGYHEFSPGLAAVLSDIRKLHARGYPVVVMPHWGDEYATTSDALQRKIAAAMAAAGASAIVGAHPHVVEDSQWIGGVPVVYSVGNLVFDQYFSSDVMHGEVVELDFAKATSGAAVLSAVELHPVSYKEGQGPQPDGAAYPLPRPGV